MAVLMAVLIGAATSANAGRPMFVDDANVDDSQTGHVDAWYARDQSATHTFFVAPSYSWAQGFEIDTLLGRNTSLRVNLLSVQLKGLFIPSQKDGCNLAGVVGMSQSQGMGNTANTPYFNGLITCNQGDFALHTNLGANRPEGSRVLASWGVALEEAVAKDFAGHVEIFGQQQSKSTVQFGLKKLLGSMQIDGTVGRTDKTNVYTLGTKYSF